MPNVSEFGKTPNFLKHKNWKQVTCMKETKSREQWWIINDLLHLSLEVNAKTLPAAGIDLSP